MTPIERAEQAIPAIKAAGHALTAKVDLPGDATLTVVALACTACDAEATYRMETEWGITRLNTIASVAAVTARGEHHLLAPCGSASRPS